MASVSLASHPALRPASPDRFWCRKALRVLLARLYIGASRLVLTSVLSLSAWP